MLYTIWVLVFFISVLIMIQYSKSKTIMSLCYFAQFVLCLILHGWSSGAYDVNIAISRYIYPSRFSSFTEIGFSFLVDIGHNLGLDYRMFYLILAAFELSVLFVFVKRNCKKYPIAMGLFLFYPSVVLFQYVRNFIAFPFIVLAIDVLLNKQKNYVIKYIILILIGTLFHFSSVFFLLFLPITILERKKAVLLTIGSFLFLLLVSNISFLYNILFYFMGPDKADMVSSTANADGNFGRFFSIVYYTFSFYAMYFLLHHVYHTRTKGDEFFFKINLLTMLCAPLTTKFAVGFARIPDFFLIFNYIYYVNCISEMKSQKKRMICYTILFILLLGMFVLCFRNEEYRKLVLYPFFEQNELFH